jgi:hypothetical protein
MNIVKEGCVSIICIYNPIACKKLLVFVVVVTTAHDVVNVRNVVDL